MPLILLIFFLMFGVPILFVIAGVSRRRKNRDGAKMMFILAAVWLIVGLGICATMLANFSVH